MLIREKYARRRGAVLVLVALLLVPLMFALAFVIDVGYMYNVQAELEATVDSASLAAAGEMSGASTAEYKQLATDAANLYSSFHVSLESDPLNLDGADIEFGDAVYDQGTGNWSFLSNPSAAAPYAVRVTVRRDGVNNSVVPRFFSKVLGHADGVQKATSAAMIAPRDIALVIDLSQSMTFDSMLLHRNETQINLRDVWVTLDGPEGSPSTRTVGGQEYITHYELNTPDQSVYAGREGLTFGSMTEWGTLIYQGLYNEPELDLDPGVYELPDRDAYTGYWGWFVTLGYPSDPRYTWLVTDLSNPNSLKSRGHTDNEIINLLKRPGSWEPDSTYQNRVKVALGLATWSDDGDDILEDNEVTTVVTEPYAQGAGWDDWINDVRQGYGLTYSSSYGGASYFKFRFGLKTYVNWLMDRQFAKDNPVSGSSGYTPQLQFTVAEPLQAVKDAVLEFTDYLKEVESNDNVGMVVYGTNAADDPFSATNGLSNDFDAIADLPYPHQAGEHGRFTNTGEALLYGYMMAHGTGSRTYAHKVIVFMSDGFTTAFNNFNVPTDLEDPATIALLQDVTTLSDFDNLFGGIPSGSITTGGYGSSAAISGRDETLAIGNILVSNHLGMGEAELNVVGVGADADIDNLLQPLAQASGGDAYHAVPDPNDPTAMSTLLKDIYRKIGGRRPVALISP
jgi:Flp pilus assembly protein TadG